MFQPLTIINSSTIEILTVWNNVNSIVLLQYYGAKLRQSQALINKVSKHSFTEYLLSFYYELGNVNKDNKFVSEKS